MVRNFGEKRKKKANNKKYKGKSSKGGRDVEESVCTEVAIYVPTVQRQNDENKSRTYDSRKPKNTYRSKRMERQRSKKDRKKDDWGYVEDYPEEDDGDYGGEYDEIIRTGPSRRETREFEQMASTSVSFINLGTRHGRNGRTRTGRNGPRSGRSGYSGGHAGLITEEFSMLDLFMMVLGSRLS